MAIEVFNRYEYKYILERGTYNQILKVIQQHMQSDPYNKDGKPYTIANIYYDTLDDALIRASLEKPSYKHKLRMRSYGVPNQNSKVFLEIKKKYKGLVNKRRTTLCLNEAYNFAETGTLPAIKNYMNEQVIKEISYFLDIYSLVPKTYIAYDRTAFFEKDNNDLRISFDRSIRTRRTNVRLEYGDEGKILLAGDVYLMEIKTSSAMPLWLTNELTRLNIQKMSFSKYGTEYKNYISEQNSIKSLKAMCKMSV